MSVTSSKLLYYLIRACLALLGLFLMMASVFSIFYPDIVHSESSRSHLRDVTFMVYGGALLVPFRWLRRSFLFPLALLIFILGVLWAVYASLPGVVGFIQGKKSWLILPVSAIFLVLAVIAPAALIMRRRLDVAK